MNFLMQNEHTCNCYTKQVYKQNNIILIEIGLVKRGLLHQGALQTLASQWFPGMKDGTHRN